MLMWTQVQQRPAHHCQVKVWQSCIRLDCQQQTALPHPQTILLHLKRSCWLPSACILKLPLKEVEGYSTVVELAR